MMKYVSVFYFRSFLNLPDMSCLWQVILYAKHYHLRCVPYPLQYQVVERSLRNMNYYHFIEQWVLICEPDLLLKMDRKVTVYKMMMNDFNFPLNETPCSH